MVTFSSHMLQLSALCILRQYFVGSDNNVVMLMKKLLHTAHPEQPLHTHAELPVWLSVCPSVCLFISGETDVLPLRFIAESNLFLFKNNIKTAQNVKIIFHSSITCFWCNNTDYEASHTELPVRAHGRMRSPSRAKHIKKPEQWDLSDPRSNFFILALVSYIYGESNMTICIKNTHACLPSLCMLNDI